MNLADSVKYVLKKKSQNIFTEFWKEDFSNLVKEFKNDFTHLFKISAKQIRNLRQSGVKFSLKEVLDSASDALTIFKVIPERVKQGFIQFRDEFALELDQLPDQKQKTIFCLKVIGALSSFVIGAVYNFKVGNKDFAFAGLKRRNAFTQFLIAELVFKISQVFILKFLTEVEKQVADPNELKNLRYFKSLLSDRNKIEKENSLELNSLPPDDKAIELVDELKNFILTGKKSSADP